MILTEPGWRGHSSSGYGRVHIGNDVQMNPGSSVAGFVKMRLNFAKGV